MYSVPELNPIKNTTLFNIGLVLDIIVNIPDANVENQAKRSSRMEATPVGGRSELKKAFYGNTNSMKEIL